MDSALNGVRVLDLSQMLAGPLTAMYLGDQGADVIKVEPLEGDMTRSVYATPSLGANNPFFLSANRNKRSISVDIKKPQGRRVLKRLIAASDVLIENLRPQVAKRLRLEYPFLSRVNPRLVHASVTGFGERGPLADRPAYDLVIQARTGIMDQRRLPDGFPLSAPLNVADCSVPMLLAYGIMLALFSRERTGKGQHVSTSLLMTAIAMQVPYLTRVASEQPSLNKGSQAVYSPYCCGDERWLNIVVLSDREWARLCTALELPHLASDPAFASASGRGAHSTELTEILRVAFATKPRDQWLEILEANDIPCAPINSRDEALREPQVLQNQMVIPFDYPAAGAGITMGIPLKLSRAPGAVRRPPPTLGQHSDEVLTEIGFSPDEIRNLRSVGALGPVDRT